MEVVYPTRRVLDNKPILLTVIKERDIKWRIFGMTGVDETVWWAAGSIKSWGTFMLWIGLVLQAGFVAVGIWQIVTSGVEFLWAAPLISHLNLAIIASYSVRSLRKRRGSLRWRVRCLALVGILASSVSVALLVAASCGKVDQHLAQCVLCVAVISERLFWSLWMRNHVVDDDELPVMQLSTLNRASSLSPADGGTGNNGAAGHRG